jgi:hypothetical protein
MQHEAASVNYYYRQMRREFGLPLSTADLDKRYQGYASLGKENEIRDFFAERYTPCKITEYITAIINNPFDPAISTKQFTDWVEARYRTTEDRYSLLDETGRYKPECVIRLLQELKVII